MEPRTIEITSEDEAWEWLDVYTKGVDLPEQALLVFKGWPVFELHLDGKDWHASIPTRLMPAILDLQKEVHRTYALAYYGEANARRLTDEERAALEIIVAVANGSSDLKADVQDAFNKLVQGALTKMEARHYVILLLGASIVLGSATMFKDWLDAQAQQRHVEALITMSGHETERLKIMTEAIKINGPLHDFKESVDEVRNRTLRSLKDQDKLLLPDATIDGTSARKLSHTPREFSKETRIDGDFRILQVDASSEDGFRVKVRRLSDGLEFITDIPIGQLSMEEQELIRAAEWEKTSVFLAINAKELRGQITSSVIMGARASETPPT